MEEIINKLLDLNAKTKGLYSIKITPSGFMHLKNFDNSIFITGSIQELREKMYKIILEQAK
jgi:hypothetical protein